MPAASRQLLLAGSCWRCCRQRTSLPPGCPLPADRYNADILQAESAGALQRRPFAVTGRFEPGAAPRFDATEVEDPNIAELPVTPRLLLRYGRYGRWLPARPSEVSGGGAFPVEMWEIRRA